MPSTSSLQPVLFARSADGLALPVIDVTDPRFAAELGPADLPERIARFIEEETRRQWVPGWLMGWFLRLAGRQSYLIRAMSAAKQGYLPALTTYFLKLGAANLVPPLDNDIDRKIVASLAAQSLRLRLEQVAALLAGALQPQLREAPGKPLCIIDIAGGPAMDALNALILLHRADPGLLAGRQIVVQVLDIDADGPHFGRNALAALTAEGAPLAGIAVEFVNVAWNWRDLPGLATLLTALGAGNAVLAASSEGGLFEYGTDSEIAGVLATLRRGTGPETVIAGSVTRDDAATRLFTRSSPFPIVPRGAARFGQLAAEAGWSMAEVRPAAFSEQVLLRRRR